MVDGIPLPVFATPANDPTGIMNAFFSVTHRHITAWGIASICSSVLFLLAYTWLPRVRRTPGWHFFYSSLCDICVAIGFVSLSLIGGTQPDQYQVDVEHAVCNEQKAMMMLILGFDMAANGWRLFMFVDLIVVYYNPFWPDAFRPLYYLLITLISGLWVFIMRQSDLLCSSSSDSVNVLTLMWALGYMPFLLFVVLGGGLYVVVKTLLSRDKSINLIANIARQRVHADAPSAVAEHRPLLHRPLLHRPLAHRHLRTDTCAQTLAHRPLLPHRWPTAFVLCPCAGACLSVCCPTGHSLQVMQHLFFYLLMYGLLFGLLSVAYANFQYMSAPPAARNVFAHLTAALTAGRPVFGFLGWMLVNGLGDCWSRPTRPTGTAAGPGKPAAAMLEEVRRFVTTLLLIPANRTPPMPNLTSPFSARSHCLRVHTIRPTQSLDKPLQTGWMRWRPSHTLMLVRARSRATGCHRAASRSARRASRRSCAMSSSRT